MAYPSVLMKGVYLDGGFPYFRADFLTTIALKYSVGTFRRSAFFLVFPGILQVFYDFMQVG